MYEKFFALSHRPFAAAPNLDAIVQHRGYVEARDRLLQCLTDGSGLAVLTAPAGLGKSLLCQDLQHRLRGRFTVALLCSAQFPTRKALLQAILFELGADYLGLSEDEARLGVLKAAQSAAEAGWGLVVIVDEAHLMSSELLQELRGLAEPSSRCPSPMRLMLSGQLELEERLATPELASVNGRIACQVVLESLTQVESAAYVHERLEMAGSRGPQFDDEALEFIIRASDGNPRCLHQLCDHCLLSAYTIEERPVSLETAMNSLEDLRALPLHWNDVGLVGDGDEDEPELNDLEFQTADERDQAEMTTRDDSAAGTDPEAIETSAEETELPQWMAGSSLGVLEIGGPMGGVPVAGLSSAELSDAVLFSSVAPWPALPLDGFDPNESEIENVGLPVTSLATDLAQEMEQEMEQFSVEHDTELNAEEATTEESAWGETEWAEGDQEESAEATEWTEEVTAEETNEVSAEADAPEESLESEEASDFGEGLDVEAAGEEWAEEEWEEPEEELTSESDVEEEAVADEEATAETDEDVSAEAEEEAWDESEEWESEYAEADGELEAEAQSEEALEEETLEGESLETDAEAWDDESREETSEEVCEETEEVSAELTDESAEEWTEEVAEADDAELEESFDAVAEGEELATDEELTAESWDEELVDESELTAEAEFAEEVVSEADEAAEAVMESATPEAIAIRFDEELASYQQAASESVEAGAFEVVASQLNIEDSYVDEEELTAEAQEEVLEEELYEAEEPVCEQTSFEADPVVASKQDVEYIVDDHYADLDRASESVSRYFPKAPELLQFLSQYAKKDSGRKPAGGVSLKQQTAVQVIESAVEDSETNEAELLDTIRDLQEQLRQATARDHREPTPRRPMADLSMDEYDVVEPPEPEVVAEAPVVTPVVNPVVTPVQETVAVEAEADEAPRSRFAQLFSRMRRKRREVEDRMNRSSDWI